MERLTHGPLGRGWGGEAFDLVAEAAARFYAAAEAFEMQGDPVERDWRQVLQRARHTVRHDGVPDTQRWSAALKKAQKKLDGWAERWENRACGHWCHGDLHPGNAMTRVPGGPAVLLDFARTRPGHWVEDAVYFEHLYWGREDKLDGRKLCRLVAQHRKAQGLVVEADWPELAQVRRALLAMAAPLRVSHEADVRHLQASLEVLERAVG